MKLIEYFYTLFYYIPMVVVATYFLPHLPLFIRICLYIICWLIASVISKINIGKEASHANDK